MNDRKDRSGQLIHRNSVTSNGMAGAQSRTTGTAGPRYETIEELFLAIESPLLTYARRLTGDHAQAEDLVQEAFLRLHPLFRQIDSPKSWLYRTVHNLAVNHHRKNARILPLHRPDASDEEESSTSDFADSHPLPDDEIARWEGIGLVRLNLKGLDPRTQEVIRLRFHEDLSYQQISEKLGLTSGHVGYLLHHALKSLAADLVKAGLTP